MSGREIQRAKVLASVVEGQLPLHDAATAMGVSLRHARRLKAVFRRDGPAGLAHGNRGRPACNRMSEILQERIEKLSREQYAGFNDVHFTEMLAEREGIVVSRDVVRRIRRAAGIAPKQRRRPRKCFGRRERKALPGEMMLWDGSPHRWFSQDRPPCCLMAAMDDAKGQALALRFEQAETSLGYLRLLDRVARRHGIPASVYQDGHSALFRNDDHWTLEEQMRGEQDPTQVGMALRDLGIQPIRALSPQAKGRVERLFRTLQDRLVAEMSLDGIDSIERANPWLEEVFLPRFNARFAVPAAGKGSLFRKTGRIDLNACLAFRYIATVGNDHAVRLGGLVLDIPPGPAKRSYAKAKVDIRQLLDGSWRIAHKGRVIATLPPTDIHEPLRARKRNRTKGTRNWTWVYCASAPPQQAQGSHNGEHFP